MVNLKKKDPPQKRLHPYEWAEIAQFLMDNAGDWYVVFEEDKIGYANTIRNGGIAALKPENGFEVRTTNTTKGAYSERTCTLFLRYTPPKKGRKKS